ncbi:hypothetical protein [Methanobrevibacter arboriphilus]|nr:hypothetical protein [Methanobrevibacter arboriphilus]
MLLDCDKLSNFDSDQPSLNFSLELAFPIPVAITCPFNVLSSQVLQC